MRENYQNNKPHNHSEEEGEYPFEDRFEGYLTNDSPGYPENHINIDPSQRSDHTHLGYHHNNDGEPNGVVAKIGFRLN